MHKYCSPPQKLGITFLLKLITYLGIVFPFIRGHQEGLFKLVTLDRILNRKQE
jgi:hypothetical protein